MNIETILTIALYTACGILAAAIWYWHNITSYVKKEQREGTAVKNNGSPRKDTTGSGPQVNDLSKIDDWWPENELTPKEWQRN